MKIKDAIIIHVKFSSVWKSMFWRCLKILHVQILSGFKNWDIQDLPLGRCYILKSCRKISLNFPQLFIIGKYVKLALKTGDHHTKNTKNITKIEKKRLLLFTFLVSLFIAFLARKLIYITNIYLTLCLADFLNKIIY